jgi:levanase
MGFTLRDGTGQRTVLEYDNRQATLSLDRRQSGDVSFSPVFADRSQAVLPLERGRLLQLHILVDRSSVEVFANNGRAVITDQIFPHFGSNKMSIYATGGTARIVNLTVRRMHSIWTR